jgi:hypothetical protein
MAFGMRQIRREYVLQDQTGGSALIGRLTHSMRGSPDAANKGQADRHQDNAGE